MAEAKRKEIEASIAAYNVWIDDVVAYGTKVNENVVAVNSSTRGEIVHEGYKLSGLKEKLRAFDSLNLTALSTKDIEAVKTQIKVLESQSLATGYDSDAVKKALDALVALRKK